MKAKKRTVWFLTLFSLTAVISVFYIFDPARDLSIRTLFTDDALEKTTVGGITDDQIPVTTDNHAFEAFRMELSNERSQLREQYEVKIGSDQVTAEEKSETYDLLNYLIQQESSEALLEMHLKTIGYPNTFVKIEEEKINVTVMSDELSKEKINEIVYLALTQVDSEALVTVDVKSNYY